MTARYISESGDELALGERGELCVKGPNVFKGYWKNAEATRNAFTSDGFYRTGDVGYENESGCLYISDRVKELIKYQAYQVAPAGMSSIASCQSCKYTYFVAHPRLTPPLTQNSKASSSTAP